MTVRTMVRWRFTSREEVLRYEEVLGIFPDDDFWRIAEVFGILSEVEEEFDPEVLADAKARLTLTEAELDGLVADGSVSPEDRQKVRAPDARQLFECA